MLTMSPTEEFVQAIQNWSGMFMHRSMHDFKRFMDETSLSFSQISVLMRLKHGGVSGVSEIGGHMGVTKAAASQAVDRLVDMGLVERTEDPHDRRVRRLALTQAGQAVIENVVAARIRWVDTLTDVLTSEEMDLITTALNLLTEAAGKTEGKSA
jgi:DNA-binding MarR family transcriptional regulator